MRGGCLSRLRSELPCTWTRIFVLYAVLIAAKLRAWVWALIACHDYPLLLGTALLAYISGLRHTKDLHLPLRRSVRWASPRQKRQRALPIGVFAVSWLGSLVVYRFNRYDEIGLDPQPLV